MTTDMRFADKTMADMALMYLALEAALAGAKKDAGLYRELLYAVESKFVGETRHQTALRYIQEREEQVGRLLTQAMRGEGE